jgi:GH25 family lysozyme M1 (1,4-beta-N-acetylmuramidase)
MKSFFTAAAGLSALVSLAAAQVPGFDISGWQETTDFAQAYANGDRFVYIKVSIESTHEFLAYIL